MKILVLGSGGREHALVWHLERSGASVECSPGSDAISRLVPTWNFKNFKELASQIHSKKITQVIVGPEKYLAEGVADYLTSENIDVFGPSKRATLLESDKAWAKDFCNRYGIPTARSKTIQKAADIDSALRSFKAPYVVKASGLAAGKGVWIGEDSKEATRFAQDMLKTHSSIVIEEFLQGEEISYFIMLDGEHHLFLGAAQDHKRLLENDRGPNTGGMGAYSPVPILTHALQKKVEENIVKQITAGLEREKIHYRGFLFIGLMIVNEEPYVLEYNCRMGDPETQALMMRLQTPLPDLIRSLSIREGQDASHRPGASINVVIAAKGYPDQPTSGFELSGIESAPHSVQIFHSGTRWNGNHYCANGGRLFSVASLQPNLYRAQNEAYSFIEGLNFLDQVTFRRDVGVKAYRHLLTYGMKEIADG